MQNFTHIINGRKFIIEEHDANDWFWSCDEADAGDKSFATQCEALQDAINWVGTRGRQEQKSEERAGEERLYRSQVNSLYYATR